EEPNLNVFDITIDPEPAVITVADPTKAFVRRTESPFVAFSYIRYEAINLWVKAPPTANLQFQLYRYNGTAADPKCVDSQLVDLLDVNNGSGPTTPLSTTVWQRITMKLGDCPNTGVFDAVKITNKDTSSVTLKLTGYVGYVDGIDRIPKYVGPAVPHLDASEYDILYSKGQSWQGWGNKESGLMAQWVCDSTTGWRGYEHLAPSDIFIHGYRDTTRGPMPMDVSSARWTGYGYEYTWAWDANTHFTRLTVDAPNPLLGCALHNADFFIIGDEQKATEWLVVWAPQIRTELIHTLATYAKYVKNKRDKEGLDIAIELRTRVPSYLKTDQYGTSHLLPKPILGNMGEMLYLDRLAPITSANQKYFQKTGYDATYDVLPIFEKLLYYNNDYYALPVKVRTFPWHVKWANLEAVLAVNNTLKVPPPLAPTSGAWWNSWTMQDFLKILEAMYLQKGLRAIFVFPPDLGHTVLWQYLSFSWGATIIDSTGRCALNNEYAEKAMDATFVNWVRNFPGLIADRKPWTQFWPDWYKYLASEPIYPLNETLFPMGVAVWNATSNTGQTKDDWAGFAISDIQDVEKGGWRKIYPPTGISQVEGLVVGLYKNSTKLVRAHDCIIETLARDDDFHVNNPRYRPNDVYGGVSGWRSALLTPEYLDDAKKLTIDNNEYLGHAAFRGYPLQGSRAWAVMAQNDPMNLAMNDIQYKNMNTSGALKRACQIIDWHTMPACTDQDYYTYPVVVPGKNKVNMVYDWKPNTLNITCRADIAKAISLPAPEIAAFASTAVSAESNSGLGLFVIAALGIAYEVGLFCTFMWKRDSQVLKAASLGASYLIFIDWALAIGFGLVLGSLAMKSFRVHVIFSSSELAKASSFSFPDWKLLACIFALVGGELICCLIYQFWQEGDASNFKILTAKTGDQIYLEDCPLSHRGATVILYVYNALLVAVAAFYAFMTRKVVSAFNENIFTASAIGLISVVVIVIAPVLNMIDTPEAIFMLVSVGTTIATILSTSVFAIPKLLIAGGIIKHRDIQESIESKMMKEQKKAMRNFESSMVAHGTGPSTGPGSSLDPTFRTPIASGGTQRTGKMEDEEP
ncbi:hypothetical protein HK097_010792, partial [Rhizophlyctis rosea]